MKEREKQEKGPNTWLVEAASPLKL